MSGHSEQEELTTANYLNSVLANNSNDFIVHEQSCANAEVPRASKKFNKVKRARPNWFVGCQIKNQQILSSLSSIQDSLVSLEPKIKTACVSVAKSHLTLHVFRASEDQIPEVDALIDDAVNEFRVRYGKNIDLKVDGLGHFNHSVLFANVKFDSVEFEESFVSLWNLIASRLHGAGFISDSDADMTHFKRHVTIAKLSRDRNIQLRKISPDLYDSKLNEYIGDDQFCSVQLLSMEKPKDNLSGYYYCHKEYPLTNPTELECQTSSSLLDVLRKEKKEIRDEVKAATVLAAAAAPALSSSDE